MNDQKEHLLIYQTTSKSETNSKIAHCSYCKKPCEIIHDLDLSVCCGAKIEFKKEVGEKLYEH